MRITMLSIGSTGDVRPYILLGRELASRGHSVTLSAFSRFRRGAEEAGLTFCPLSGSAENMMAAIMEPDTNGLTYLPRLWKSLKSTAPRMLEDMSEGCRGADAMVCNFFGSVYYSVAEKYGIPCIQTQFFPMDPTGKAPISSVRSQRLGPAVNKATYKAGYYLIGSLEKHILSSWRKENGVTVRKPSTGPDYRIGGHTVPVIYAISPCVFPRPEEWGPKVYMSGFWFDESPCAWQPPKDLVEFMSAGEKPVYIGFGSMSSGDMNRLMTIVLRAVRAAGLRAVISTGWTGRKMKSNRTVYFADYIPHDWLFPRVRAVVHHGGAGTVAAGLRHGRPTLVIPFAGDQPFWGYQVHRIGCGPKPIARSALTVRKLTKALLELTGRGEYYEKAREVSGILASEHGTAAAADLIEKAIQDWDAE